MTSDLRLLIVDDSPAAAEAIVSLLAAAGYSVHCERVDGPDALLAALTARRWDLAVGDFALGRFSGLAALRVVHEHDPDLPFLIVSSTGGEDAAVAALKAGARDFIVKRHLKRLLPAVRRELRDGAGRRARRRAEERLAHLAYHDALTDLPNRTLLHDRLSQALRLAQRAGEPLALLALDLDGFKGVNDTYGHHAGDRVLQHAAAAMRRTLREADTVARLGGDEFAVVLPSTDVGGAVAVARKLLDEVERPMLYRHRPLSVRASVGVASYPGHGRSADVLLQKADVAMYVAKADGAGVAVYDPRRDRRANRRVTLVSELRRAIEERQFFVEYQPILHLRSGIVAGLEALARWDHPRHGRLMPDTFIRLMEQTGLITDLTFLVLDTAAADWSAAAPQPLSISVNLSARCLEDADLPHRVADRLASWSAGVTLAFEVTENIVMADPGRALESLERLHGMGVRLVLDDFGTGYSSLSYLRQLPIDEIKIDRSFVLGLGQGQDELLARAGIELAHTLGLTASAAGVEHVHARSRLLDLGCDLAQGTFIGAPAAVESVRRWLTEETLLGLMERG